jgi:hypothetical protein
VDDEPVVIDVSPAETLSEADARAWAGEQRVFVSSVMTGMETERVAVAAAIEEMGAYPVWFERFGGRDDDPTSAYLTEVASSDVYVGILGERYGTQLSSGYSATHAEYREAVAQGLRVCVWVHDGTLSGPQRDFVEEVRVFKTTGTYRGADDLAAGVARRLHALASDALSPWVKLGRVILRARQISHDGAQITIVARVRDPEVMAALEAMRPDGTWRTTRDTTMTWACHTEAVRVESVRTETTAGRGGLVTVVGRCLPRGQSHLLEASFNGHTPEDLTDIALRVALFGEENPLGSMAFMARLDNPFDVISGHRLPADVVEPVTGLLLTEALVGSGRADRITHLSVGPQHRGGRRVVLDWVPRRRYTNVIPERRRVEGVVATGRD